MLSCLARSTMLQLRRSTRLQSKLSNSSSPLTPLEDGVDRFEEHRDAISQSGRKPKRKKRADDNSEDDFVVEKRLRNKRMPEPDPVCIIPDVERKETTFRGYACLNTVLRSRRPAKEAIFCSRTCRLNSLRKNGIDWVKDLGRKNVQDLISIIEWNEQNNIRFFRISSEMFPFASHGVYGYSLEYCSSLLACAGDLANKYGHRLTAHPGQFTQLGSPKARVIEASVRELEYHCEMLDRMGIGPDGVLIVHGGGVYGDKGAAINRIKHTIKEVLPPKVRDRLVLENDELCYNAEDLLPICEELDVPLVFDYHHDMLNPSLLSPSVIIQRADAIWKRRGIRPKQHLSEPRLGAVTLMEQRAHADRCQALPPDLPDDMDLMIEVCDVVRTEHRLMVELKAKDKEQAVLHLHRIYDLQPVIHESLRPPDLNPTKETNGRKSLKQNTGKVTDERNGASMEDETD